MKKTLSALLVAVLLFAMAIPAFGATADINTYEQKLLDYVKTAYDYTVDDTYISAAKTAFTKIDLTEDQYNQIKAILDKALAYVKENKLVSVEKDIYGNATHQKVLLDYAAQALAVCGYSLKVDRAANTLTILDGAGAVIATLTPKIVKQTGVSYTSVAALGFAVVAAVACAGVSVKAFRKEDEE